MTRDSIDRMNGIVERTHSRLAWEWYESALQQKTKLFHQRGETPALEEVRKERIANLERVLVELLPLVREKLDELEQGDF